MIMFKVLAGLSSLIYILHFMWVRRKSIISWFKRTYGKVCDFCCVRKNIREATDNRYVRSVTCYDGHDSPEPPAESRWFEIGQALKRAGIGWEDKDRQRRRENRERKEMLERSRRRWQVE